MLRSASMVTVTGAVLTLAIPDTSPVQLTKRGVIAELIDVERGRRAMEVEVGLGVGGGMFHGSGARRR